MWRVAAALLVLALAPAVVSAASKPPTEAAALVAAGGRALAAGDLETAERRFDEARKAAPELATGWLGLAEVREGQGRLAEALRLARTAQELAPDSAATHRVTGRLLARLGVVQPALAALARARELEPSAEEPWILGALLLRDLGRLDEAVETLREARARGAGSAELSRELVLLELAADRPAEALRDAEAAAAAHPEDAELQFALALALGTEPERGGDAIAALEAALAAGVGRPGLARLELGSHLLAAGRSAEAVAELERAAGELPDRPEVFYKLAQALRAGGDVAGAERALARFQDLRQRRDAAERLAKETGIALNEAQSLAGADRLAEALEQIDSLLASHPEEPRAHGLRAKVLFSLGRGEDALVAIGTARHLRPGSAELAYLEGVFLLAAGRPAEAEAALLDAVDLAPGLAEAWERLARLALDGGRPEAAAERYARAVELAAEDPGLRLFYAEALERAGRAEESARQMDVYRRLRRQ